MPYNSADWLASHLASPRSTDSASNIKIIFIETHLPFFCNTYPLGNQLAKKDWINEYTACCINKASAFHIMASLTFEAADVENDAARPRKRPRLSPSPPPSFNNNLINSAPQPSEDTTMKNHSTPRIVMSTTAFQPEREPQVGILEYVNLENPGFTGTLKQRYVSSSLYQQSSLP